MSPIPSLLISEWIKITPPSSVQRKNTVTIADSRKVYKYIGTLVCGGEKNGYESFDFGD